ncbi:hypothetical protein BKP37_18555 [Anaerobacillus alkalilacustris]|uniref:DNA 3'-5' helicase n=1 Tax=Anaerobacillus alkalilacustris TaxID=393763 RepID=A0A1S2LDV0_9BACI|nr:UvrD-helicase domain-containing protein [Anaerobacillus alkalilacustris]OIJ10536.1 hypothetical protein BKP37_18555 [Anaerobacillus alkalilacustris]
MNFNEEQKAAIYSEKPLVVISAGAGSGKTRVLTERFVYICEEKLKERLGKKKKSPIGATVEEIVAITFTEKAAREMKDRIRGRIEEIRQNVHERYDASEHEFARNFWQEQKDALDGALITTFHSFCHKLLGEYAFLADVPPKFTVLDDVGAKLIQIDIFDEMFDSPEYHRKWRPLYNFYTRGQLKEAIKAVYSQMKEIITSVDSIESFFDSETIVKLQLQSIESDRKFVLTNFYKEARPHVMELDDSDKASKKITEHFSEVTDLSFENPVVLYEALEEALPKKVNKKWQETNPPLYDLFEYLYKPLKETWKKLKGPSSVDIKEIKEIINLFVQVLQVFHEKYDEAKRERAAMDFSDLQQKAITLLEKKEVQDDCRKKYRHMMIDEAQDTNQLQMNMLTFIQPNYKFIVGDGKQSIYRFRGADVSLMNELVDFSKKDLNSDFINMSTNYRTCESIISFVNIAFNEIMGAEKSELDPLYKIHYTNINSHRTGIEEQKCRVELITIPKEDEPKEGIEGQAEQADDEQSEFEVIANRMLEIMEEGQSIVSDKEAWRAPSWSDFAILIQTRTKLSKLERSLKQKGIPYVVYGGIGFYEKQEIRDMITLLNWLNRPWESLYILSLLRSPLFGVSVEDFLSIDECLEEDITLATFIYEGLFDNVGNIGEELKSTLSKLKQFYEDWVPYRPQVSTREYFEDLFLKSGLKKMLLLQKNNLQQIKNVEKLIDVLAQFQTASLDELLKQVKQLADLSDKEGEAEVELAEGNMVHIMTVHASKGLEFPIVFLPDLAKGPRGDSGNIRFDKDVRIVLQYEKEIENEPLKKPDKKYSPSFERIKEKTKDQAIEESKRLFYVATTRAKDYLVLSTVDKPAKDSWYDMLLKAMEQDQSLENRIKQTSNVPDYEEWQEKGQEYEPPLIENRDKVLPSFSVSEIMIYMNDPIKYYYKYIVKIEDEWLAEQDDLPQIVEEKEFVSGAKLGTIVHRACELLDNGFSLEEAQEEALALLEEEQELGDYEQAVSELVTKYQALNELRLGSNYANEWAFIVEIEGAQIIGEIDKIVEKNEEFHLIDLKTNKSNDYQKLVKYYTPQLYLYKMAFEQITRQKVSELSLFFMREGLEGFASIEIDKTMEERIREVIKEMSHLKMKLAAKDSYERIG